MFCFFLVALFFVFCSFGIKCLLCFFIYIYVILKVCYCVLGLRSSFFLCCIKLFLRFRVIVFVCFCVFRVCCLRCSMFLLRFVNCVLSNVVHCLIYVVVLFVLCIYSISFQVEYVFSFCGCLFQICLWSILGFWCVFICSFVYCFWVFSTSFWYFNVVLLYWCCLFGF